MPYSILQVCLLNCSVLCAYLFASYSHFTQMEIMDTHMNTKTHPHKNAHIQIFMYSYLDDINNSVNSVL
jgi:oligoribonuclease NrnB/cAMP/cGMP phosphodiesterase (DHH superfamily)